MAGFSRRAAGKIGLVNVNTVFGEAQFNIMRTEPNPFIGGPTNPMVHRILDGDVLVSPVPDDGIDSGDCDIVMERYIPVISVVNGIGEVGQTKDQVLKKLWFVGISNGNAESSAIGTGAATAIAATRQGRISTINKWNGEIKPGDTLMFDIPDGTEDAKEIFSTLESGVDENMPADRFTAFLRPVSKTDIQSVFMEDIIRQLRPDGFPTVFSFSPKIANLIRTFFAMGALHTAAYGVGQIDAIGVDVPAALGNLRDIAIGQPARLEGVLVERVINGVSDPLLAALLSPGPNQLVTPGRIGMNATNLQQIIASFQETGLLDLMTLMDHSMAEAGKNRIVATALTGAKQGQRFTIVMRT